MAPVALEDEVSYAPLALVVSHVLTAIFLTGLVGKSLYRSQQELRPSQETRMRVSSRSKLVPTFASLSVLGLLLAGYSGISYATLSYNVWADERGIAVPDSLWAMFGRASGTQVSRFHLRRWLNDTPVYIDAFEVVFEKASRLWWGQQLELGMIPWSMLLAIEGRRRKIPYLWAFLTLAHLVNLSFAQNLFYLALLLTPSPLPPKIVSRSGLSRLVSRAFPPKPSNWSPKPVFFWVSLMLNYGAVFLLPHAPGTVSVTKAVAWTKALSFAPLIVPAIIPESWGSVQSHPHDFYRSHSLVFRFMSVLNFLMHGTATLVGLFWSLPGSHRHRHSIRIPFDTEKRSKWERTATAFERVLGSVSDHPSVASASRDVILSGISLGLWAALRSFDYEDMFKSAIPWYNASTNGPAEEALDAVGGRSPVDDESVESIPASKIVVGSRRGRGRPRDSSSTMVSGSLTVPSPARRRGRPRKSIASSESEPDADPDEVPGDETYQPGPEEEACALEGDILRQDGYLDWESAALAWGLTTLGGLGLGSTAVFGAECISR